MRWGWSDSSRVLVPVEQRTIYQSMRIQWTWIGTKQSLWKLAHLPAQMESRDLSRATRACTVLCIILFLRCRISFYFRNFKRRFAVPNSSGITHAVSTESFDEKPNQIVRWSVHIKLYRMHAFYITFVCFQLQYPRCTSGAQQSATIVKFQLPTLYNV